MTECKDYTASAEMRVERLLKACRKGDFETVKELYKANVDMKLQHNKPLRVAAEHGYLEIVAFLVESCQADVSAEKFEAFRLAASNGQDDVVRYFLFRCPQKVDVSAVGQYASIQAAARGHVSILRILFEDYNYRQRRGSDVRARLDTTDNLALKLAAGNCRLETVKYILEESGEEVDATAQNGEVISTAAEEKCEEVVNYLAKTCYGVEPCGDLADTLLACDQVEKKTLVELRKQLWAASKAKLKLRLRLKYHETPRVAGLRETRVEAIGVNQFKVLVENAEVCELSSYYGLTDGVIFGQRSNSHYGIVDTARENPAFARVKKSRLQKAMAQLRENAAEQKKLEQQIESLKQELHEQKLEQREMILRLQEASDN